MDSRKEQAGKRAEGALDYESDGLMHMWVGDLSKPLNEAKEQLHEIADAPPPGSNAGKAAFIQDDDDAALMGVLEDHGMADSTTTTTTTTTKRPTAAELKSKIEAASKDIDKETKASDKKIAQVKSNLKEAEKKASETVKADE